jgi:hypothetical protein
MHMARQATSPSDLATRFKIEALKAMSAEKRKDIEEKERKTKEELERIEHEAKKELEELERAKQRELEEEAQMLEQAIEESRIDERLWRETDERLVRDQQQQHKVQQESIDQSLRNQEEINQLAHKTSGAEYQPLPGREFLATQGMAQREEEERRRRIDALYERNSEQKPEPARESNLAAERGPDYDPFHSEDVMDTIDPTRSALKKMGYKR